ncbi:hypothetical protein ACTIVE_5525 [Actinomadura verrucosospora]|uniref:Uncharacterized protein n=1 Tax=Actinomadura verrucosospora TaxID=46165 RepID=A0A7D3ZQ89_ACTVE|nr:hypothetical protein ACTIVE_5525 [Actinomadura verrucosospora]
MRRTSRRGWLHRRAGFQGSGRSEAHPRRSGLAEAQASDQGGRLRPGVNWPGGTVPLLRNHLVSPLVQRRDQEKAALVQVGQGGDGLLADVVMHGRPLGRQVAKGGHLVDNVGCHLGDSDIALPTGSPTTSSIALRGRRPPLRHSMGRPSSKPATRGSPSGNAPSSSSSTAPMSG